MCLQKHDHILRGTKWKLIKKGRKEIWKEEKTKQNSLKEKNTSKKSNN
jgi:hypothetical protein